MRSAALLFAAGLLAPAHHLAAQEADSFAARTKGSPAAPVTVYEMAQFQCPACCQFSLDTFPVIDHYYIRPGKARWAFVNFPLGSPIFDSIYRAKAGAPR